ncbi:hypothetical protein KAFR_0E04380 [Kazachstania africana CBS 2517]|uniref:TATA-binding protein interacting (TIP20) domain-containing protein n=1 Tax=Kazachstania africana (strain ATCC 22294 / BCRC 22015 / CBS 2517 / CECT 1963 / NBRC 1671 / NRRL Y-8276) TaxID=1071382 RepID=H2AW38_KAZAF|nr:hypothetical protein KAFR_0E04380 [Kazachstania africana CBS 2517]CCF58588.1 hypothetical protein KAFR_0E04380 [Kazachstania africana CBS 2517]
MTGLYERFVAKCNTIEVPQADSELKEDIETLSVILKEDASRHNLKYIRYNAIKALSYFTMDPDMKVRKIAISTMEELCAKDSNLLPQLIDDVRNSLQKLGHRGKDEQNGLKPQLGLALKGDKIMSDWKSQGGLKDIPIFNTILLNLPRNQISENLWWIRPGILSLLDDTTDLRGIKLNGVKLLGTLVDRCFIDVSDKWISFKETGLFDLTEPMVRNLCYYLPPTYSMEDSISVFEAVIPTLRCLYKAQYDIKDCKDMIGAKILSQILLQHVIPRIGIRYEKLSELVISDIMCPMIRSLGETCVPYLQRIIFTVGEYLVRDPFITTSKSLVNAIINVLESVIDAAGYDNERIIAHQYDFLAMIIILFEKCENEGIVNDLILKKLKALVFRLNLNGSDIESMKHERVRLNKLFS